MTGVQWSDEYRAIAELLGQRAGLSFRPSGRDTVEQAIAGTMEAAGFSGTVEYLNSLKSDADAFDHLLAATTSGETYFFRDSGQFRIVTDLVLPDIRRRRGRGHTIRFWSAGCASGEEAYSLAMLLHRSGALSQANILGTDVSREALERARNAIYQECSLCDEGVEMAKPYLTQKNGQYHVNATMKKSVRFEYLNLALDTFPSIRSGTRGMDLILCRNVLLYYDQATIHSVVGRLFRSLAEGGWLIIAPSDPPIHEYEMFDFVPTEHGLAYRKANLSFRGQSVADPDAGEALDVNPTAVAATAETQDTPKRVARPSSSPRVTGPSSSPRVTRPTSDTEGARPSAARRVARPPGEKKVARPLGNKRLAEARQALADGDHQRAADLTTDMRGEGAIIHIKAMASIDVTLAAKACEAATTKRPLSQELNYLKAVLMMDLNRHQEAAESLRRVLYLDESLALVHFRLGTALRKLGDIEGAQQAFRSTLEICDRSPPDQPVPLGNDETAGQLRALAKTQLDAIQ